MAMRLLYAKRYTKKGKNIMKKIITPIVAGTLLLSTNALAAEIKSVVMSDFDNSILTVSGTVADGEKNVSVVLVKKGNKLSEGISDGSTASVQIAKINGSDFVSEFQFLGDEGTYEIYASNSEKPFEFEYVQKADVLKFVESLGKREVAQNDIVPSLGKYGGNIGVDISFANDEKTKSYLAKSVWDNYTVIAENGIEGVKTVVLRAKAELEFMQKLQKAAVASAVNNLLVEYEKTAGIDLSSYNNLTDIQKSKVATRFVESIYSDMNKFREDFKKAVEDAPKDGSDGNKGNTGGNKGGSSGGSSGGSLNPTNDTVPSTIKNPENNDEEKDDILFRFPDIKDFSWAWESVSYLVNNNIINGVSENEFKPSGNVTREQFAKIITLAFNKYNPELRTNFADADADAWYSSYVESAKVSGYMRGVRDDTFGVGASIKREDICVAIYRAAKENGYTFANPKTDFTDFEEVSDYAKEAVSMLAGEGIINGMGDGSFAPKKETTRAQAAKLMYAVIGGKN